jgi:hypothetical protein
VEVINRWTVLAAAVTTLALVSGVAVVGATNVVDLDGDGVPAGQELLEGTDPLAQDTDGDGLDDGRELDGPTSPTEADTDGDGLDDQAEVDGPSDPTRADTDGDGLDDGRERDLGTDPVASDTDGDGLADRTEVDGPTDPTVADTDGDGLDDGTEREVGSDPTVADSDDDGLEDGRERELGTDPTAADTDADGLDDRTEVQGPTDPTASDTDDDRLDDGRELELGTDPLAPDTDGDGLLDGSEVRGRTADGVALPDADPLEMDLYVQINHGSNVVAPSPYSIGGIEDYFARMPVENPDGTTGIDLHANFEGSLGQSATYTGSNFHALADLSEDARGERTPEYHGVLFAEFDTGDRSIGVGSTPGDFSVIDAGTSGSDQEAIVVHELLHNVMGELEAPGRCTGDPAHYCNGGFLEPRIGNGRYLPTVLGNEIERNGFESDVAGSRSLRGGAGDRPEADDD